jgi:1-acyl-sn-glycerol-3-phosphate acyltransferase
MKSTARWFLSLIIRLGTSIICRIEKQDFYKIPPTGPLILVTNHIGSLEVPLIAAYLHPRRLIGLAKVETWENKFMGWLFDQWEAIPVHRGEADMEAIRACLATLKNGRILGIAPEGTRSKNGKLLPGQPGITILALKADVPILPMAHWGVESFSANIKKLKRTDFYFKVGREFRLDCEGEKVNAEVRQQMVDEIMFQIAVLMPLEYRGHYASLPITEPKYLRFN